MSFEVLQDDKPTKAQTKTIIEQDKHAMEEAANLGDDACAAFEKDDLNKALDLFRRAYEMLPIPRREWPQSGFFLAGQGDVYLQRKQWTQARVCFELALKCAPMADKPMANIYYHKQLGIAAFEARDIETAKVHLGCALLAQKDGSLFAEDNPKYLKYIRSCMKLKP